MKTAAPEHVKPFLPGASPFQSRQLSPAGEANCFFMRSAAKTQLLLTCLCDRRCDNRPNAGGFTGSHRSEGHEEISVYKTTLWRPTFWPPAQFYPLSAVNPECI